MKKLFLLPLAMFPLLSFSQVNLVPNPSFENYSLCPDNLNQLPRCDNWFNPTGGSPDYYNSCSASLFADIPLNTYGYQDERTGGNAYAGISLFNLSPDEREYVAVRLTQTLVAGKKYCISYYVSFADLAELSSSRLGVYFSADSVSATFASNLPYIPQTENPYNNFIRDSVGWVAVSGIYTAAGGERFLTLGNFYDDANTDTSRVNPGIYQNSYYYLDDISLVEMVYDVADAGADSEICNGNPVTLGAPACNGCIYDWTGPNGSFSTSAQPEVTPDTTTTYTLYMHDTSTGTMCEYFSTDVVTIVVKDCHLPPPNVFTPNNDGFNDVFKIEFLPPQSKLVVFNRWGGEVFSSSNYDNSWKADKFADGIYYYILSLESGETNKGFVQILR